MKKDVKILNKETLYAGFFRMEKYHLQHELFKGGLSHPISRELFVRSDCVAVVLFDAERDSVVLIEQFRVGAIEKPINTAWLVEIVAGIIEENETMEVVAKRESLEEAGCDIQTLIPISTFYLSPGGSSEKITLFCGLINSENVGGVHGVLTESEDILVKVVPFSNAYQQVLTNTIDSAIPIIALQWLALHRHELMKKV
jgi:ADP-ribose pyrophosphatase